MTTRCCSCSRPPCSLRACCHASSQVRRASRSLRGQSCGGRAGFRPGRRVQLAPLPSSPPLSFHPRRGHPTLRAARNDGGSCVHVCRRRLPDRRRRARGHAGGGPHLPGAGRGLCEPGKGRKGGLCGGVSWTWPAKAPAPGPKPPNPQKYCQAVPLYLSEMAPTHLRGALNIMFQAKTRKGWAAAGRPPARPALVTPPSLPLFNTAGDDRGHPDGPAHQLLPAAPRQVSHALRV